MSSSSFKGSKTSSRAELLTFCQSLPKAELHAHLTGCIRKCTLEEFLKASNLSEIQVQEVLKTWQVVSGDSRSLKQCFQIFDAIYKAVTTVKRVTRVTLEALDDFAKDNVTYLELRTTPRYVGPHDPFWSSEVIDKGEQYVQSVINALEYGGKESYVARGMTARVLLSCNRAQGVERARDILNLALLFARKKRFSPETKCRIGEGWVVGIEFSGNPYIGGFVEFEEIYASALKSGLSCSIHCGETTTNSLYPNKCFEDNNDIISFIKRMQYSKQDGRLKIRLGHASLITDEQWDTIHNTKVPIEICPTSNLATLKLKDLSKHSTLHKAIVSNHPFVICTDDSGVFNTSLSIEYFQLATAFKFNRDDLRILASQSFKYAFSALDEATRWKSSI